MTERIMMTTSTVDVVIVTTHGPGEQANGTRIFVMCLKL